MCEGSEKTVSILNTVGKSIAISIAANATMRCFDLVKNKVKSAIEELGGTGSAFFTAEDEDRKERNVVFEPQYDAEDGTPAQDVVFVGDSPYVLVRFECDGSLIKIRSGGITKDSEPWVLQDTVQCLGGLLEYKYLTEFEEADYDEE